jgi:hypothetical protein
VLGSEVAILLDGASYDVRLLDMHHGGATSLEKSMSKLHEQNSQELVEAWHRSRPIYLNFGLSDAKDTELYLSKKGYNTLSVEAFLPWIDKAKTKFAEEIKSNRALFFNAGIVEGTVKGLQCGNQIGGTTTRTC